MQVIYTDEGEKDEFDLYMDPKKTKLLLGDST